MSEVGSITYLMEDPREASRLETKVDPQAWVQKYLAPRVRAGADVLSVGCGPGVILSAVTALQPSVTGTGIDISSDRVREAVERNRGNSQVEFVCGDAQAMQFPSDSFDLVYTRVDTGPAFKEALRRDDWDVIISDYSLPRYDGLAALADIRETGRDIPFILVSGTVAETGAVRS